MLCTYLCSYVHICTDHNVHTHTYRRIEGHSRSRMYVYRFQSNTRASTDKFYLQTFHLICKRLAEAQLEAEAAQSARVLRRALCPSLFRTLSLSLSRSLARSLSRSLALSLSLSALCMHVLSHVFFNIADDASVDIRAGDDGDCAAALLGVKDAAGAAPQLCSSLQLSIRSRSRSRCHSQP